MTSPTQKCRRATNFDAVERTASLFDHRGATTLVQIRRSIGIASLDGNSRLRVVVSFLGILYAYTADWRQLVAVDEG